VFAVLVKGKIIALAVIVIFVKILTAKSAIAIYTKKRIKNPLLLYILPIDNMPLM
jgi:hypothetical protein